MTSTIVVAIGFLFVTWTAETRQARLEMVDATGNPPAAVVSQAGARRSAPRPAGQSVEERRQLEELLWCMVLGFCPEEAMKMWPAGRPLPQPNSPAGGKGLSRE